MDQSAIQGAIDTVKSAIHAVTFIDWNLWITTVATAVLAILTAFYVLLTARILEAQSNPSVILTVVHDEERGTILQLVTKNVGTGLAHDIRFEFSRPLPARVGLSTVSAKEIGEMKEGPLIDGIPALGPGECRKIDWGLYGGLVALLGNNPIVATCKFKKNGKEMPPTRCPLDVRSFAGTVASKSSSAIIAQEVENISKTIGRFASGFHKLRVEVTSLPSAADDDEST